MRSLERDELVKSFDCGDTDLNDFIFYESPLYRKALLAVSYIVENTKENNKVEAYFSMANDRVSLTDFKNTTEFNRFRRHRFVNEKRLRSYPAVKLCRLGVDQSAKGIGMGSFILDFIKSFFVVKNKTGCRFITVDAYNDAVPFYLKNGFLPLTSEEETDSHTKLLYYDLYSNYI